MAALRNGGDTCRSAITFHSGSLRMEGIMWLQEKHRQKRERKDIQRAVERKMKVIHPKVNVKTESKPECTCVTVR